MAPAGCSSARIDSRADATTTDMVALANCGAYHSQLMGNGSWVGWSTENQSLVTGSSVPKAEVQEASPDLQRADNQRSF